MPNQPKTPSRTFRLDDATMMKVDSLGGLNRSDAIRKAVDGIHALKEAIASGLPDGISLDAMAAAEGVNVAALMAADDASWMNVHMPSPEANRRLLAALVAARPFLVEQAEHDERQRTLRDVITRLEGWVPTGDVSQLVIDHLKSLLD